MLDEKDWRILELLQQNSKLSTYKIARKTLFPVTTIYHRIKKMEKEGIIKKYTVELDHKKLGQAITAYILVHYNISTWGRETTREELRKNLLQLPFTEEIMYISGEYDILLKVRLPGIEELNNLLLAKLRKIPGIGQTNSVFILEEVK